MLASSETLSYKTPPTPSPRAFDAEGIKHAVFQGTLGLSEGAFIDLHRPPNTAP